MQAHAAFKDWLESMKELFNFSPHRLHLQANLHCLGASSVLASQ